MTTSSPLSGRNLIDGAWCSGEGTDYAARNPATGDDLPTAFGAVSDDQVRTACLAAAAAAPVLAAIEPNTRAEFLERAADGIAALGADMEERATAETALPAGRIQMEKGRTAGQLRMFAGVVREGSWVGARLDRPDSQRQPIPKPDVRRMLEPLGPVAIFGASNFPLAFSTAGGDTHRCDSLPTRRAAANRGLRSPSIASWTSCSSKRCGRGWPRPTARNKGGSGPFLTPRLALRSLSFMLPRRIRGQWTRWRVRLVCRARRSPLGSASWSGTLRCATSPIGGWPSRRSACARRGTPRSLTSPEASGTSPRLRLAWCSKSTSSRHRERGVVALTQARPWGLRSGQSLTRSTILL